MQGLNFFMGRCFGQEIVADSHDLVNQGLWLGLDGFNCRMHFLRNQNQLFLCKHQGLLELNEQGHQFVNGQLNLCHHLAEDAP